MCASLTQQGGGEEGVLVLSVVIVQGGAVLLQGGPLQPLLVPVVILIFVVVVVFLLVVVATLYYSPKRECKIKECMRNGIQRLRLGSDLFGKPYSGAAHVLAVNNSLVLPSGAIFLLEKIWAFNFTHQFKRNRQ